MQQEAWWVGLSKTGRAAQVDWRDRMSENAWRRRRRRCSASPPSHVHATHTSTTTAWRRCRVVLLPGAGRTASRLVLGVVVMVMGSRLLLVVLMVLLRQVTRLLRS